MEEALAKEATEETVGKALKEYRPNPAMQSALAIMPKSFIQVMEMADVFAKSGLVPDAMKGKKEACAIAILHGLELGVSPSQAVNNIMVVNGRPSVWGDLMLAIALGSGQLEFFEEDAPDKALKQMYGRCVCKRAGASNPIERVFSLEDAKRAGLLTKDTWRNYTGRMLMYRARSWALRDCIPHVLKGLQMREEVMDMGSVPEGAVRMPERARETSQDRRGETIQEAEIVGGGKPENAAPAPGQAAPNEEQDMVGDAQEPVEAIHEALVNDAERKDLFKLRSEAGINIQDTKAFMKQAFGVEDTAKLTQRQGKELKAWFQQHARK